MCIVDVDLDESIKRSASDRLGDLVPQVRARTSPGVFRDMALLGLCLELSFSVLYCRTQANLPTLINTIWLKKDTVARKRYHTINFVRLLVMLEKREGACGLFVRKKLGYVYQPPVGLENPTQKWSLFFFPLRHFFVLVMSRSHFLFTHLLYM